jgi:two-component system nitrate/nitrite sensor histidine kinase NarX
MMTTRQPLLVNDTMSYGSWVLSAEQLPVCAYLSAPIISDNEVIGFINLDSQRVNFFKPEHAERLKAFAGQAAIAIKNARAFEQAKDLAAAKERERIARELHDAVSQTLFSASVMSETLPLLMDIDMDEVRKGLAQLARLTKGALSEMRSLLVELRPAALQYTDLSVLLSHLANSLRTRIDAEVNLSIKGQEFSFEPDAKINLYRIAQEALNNVVKHARASLVEISLEYQPDQIKFDVRDNGRGFDPDSIAGGHLGLGIMRDRAIEAQIKLSVSSRINQGTTIEALWQRGTQDE